MKSLLTALFIATLMLIANPADASHRYGHGSSYGHHYGNTYGYNKRGYRHGYRQRGYRHGYRNRGYRNGYRNRGYRNGYRYRGYRGYRNRGYRYGRGYYRSSSSDRAAYALGGLALGALLTDSAHRSRGPEVVDRRVINTSNSAPVHNGPLPSTYYRLDGSDCLLMETKSDGRRTATPVAGEFCQ